MSKIERLAMELWHAGVHPHFHFDAIIYPWPIYGFRKSRKEARVHNTLIDLTYLSANITVGDDLFLFKPLYP